MIKAPENMIRPAEIINIIVRRRWFIIIPFCLSTIVGSYLAFTMPKIYEASTLILVEPQRVPTNFVQSVVSMDISARLRTISEQVMSRTNIERIIGAYKMFTQPEHSDMFMEDKINSVRKRIEVNVKQSSTFSISFRDSDPEKVKNIANALATYFIDENLKVREAQAVGTSVFLEDELKTMRARLEDSEQRLRAYRQMHMGELPDQLTSNLSVLTRYSEQLIEKQKALREAKASLATAERQISETQRMQSSMPMFDDSSLADLGTENSGEIGTLKEQLAQLKIRYKDRHPEVLRLQGMISKLEAEKAAEPNEMKESEPVEKDIVIPQVDFMALQRSQLEDSRRQIAIMEADIAVLGQKIDDYQKRVENTPKREEELLSIKRDYENVKGIYESLLKRKLEAEISVNMEKKQKGEQFRIIDPARLPEKPISPNMPRLFIMTLAAGLGLGGGLIFLIEFLNTTYRNKEDIESTLNVPVLAAIPRILQPKDKRKQKLELGFCVASLCFSIGLFICFAVITSKGPEKIIAFVKTLI
ncbi:MAG: GNVR domain-containing protein [Desulfobacterales bacterium]|jgi:polysaccharide chain length determinant protein (PEP-CTERM system associated)|nr:GNVR domain-containing protein [Desulfobacterales bacterium]